MAGAYSLLKAVGEEPTLPGAGRLLQLQEVFHG